MELVTAILVGSVLYGIIRFGWRVMHPAPKDTGAVPMETANREMIRKHLYGRP